MKERVHCYNLPVCSSSNLKTSQSEAKLFPDKKTIGKRINGAPAVRKLVINYSINSQPSIETKTKHEGLFIHTLAYLLLNNILDDTIINAIG